MPFNSRFERRHAAVHTAIGGHLESLLCAPYDPVFFLLHCGVDYYYDLYLQNNRGRTITYPRSRRTPSNQGAREAMRPFVG